MRRSLYVFLVFAAVYVALACGGSGGGEERESPSPTSAAIRTAAPVEETLSHYENTELGFTFDYPDQWEQLALAPPSVEVEAGEVQILAEITVGTLEGAALLLSGMDVTVNRLEEAILEDEFFEVMDTIMEQVAGQLGGLLEEKDWTELAGRKARRYVIQFTLAGVPLTSEQVTTMREDLQFTLDCQGERDRFEEVRADCPVVLDSFEFTAEQ